MPPGTADALRIVMVASEAQPFSKTGGLADVTTSLSRALGRLGQDVTVFTPRYRGVEGGTGAPLSHSWVCFRALVRGASARGADWAWRARDAR